MILFQEHLTLCSAFISSWLVASRNESDIESIINIYYIQSQLIYNGTAVLSSGSRSLDFRAIRFSKTYVICHCNNVGTVFIFHATSFFKAQNVIISASE